MLRGIAAYIECRQRCCHDNECSDAQFAGLVKGYAYCARDPGQVAQGVGELRERDTHGPSLDNAVGPVEVYVVTPLVAEHQVARSVKRLTRHEICAHDRCGEIRVAPVARHQLAATDVELAHFPGLVYEASLRVNKPEE